MWRKYVALCFVVNGLAKLPSKMLHEAGYDAFRGVYLLARSGAALAMVVLFLVIRRKRFALRDVLIGCPMGLLGLSLTALYLVGLSKMEATVLFPLGSAGGVVLTCLFSYIFWKEKPHGWPGYLGLAVGVVAVALLAG